MVEQDYNKDALGTMDPKKKRIQCGKGNALKILFKDLKRLVFESLNNVLITLEMRKKVIYKDIYIQLNAYKPDPSKCNLVHSR